MLYQPLDASNAMQPDYIEEVPNNSSETYTILKYKLWVIILVFLLGDSIELRNKPIKNKGYCGVPQCYTHKQPNTTLVRIPKTVKNNPVQLKKWSAVLRMGKKFPNQFRICHKHFDPKSILIPLSKHNKTNPTLLKTAFPCKNLPVLPSIRKTRESGRDERLARRNRIVETSR